MHVKVRADFGRLVPSPPWALGTKHRSAGLAASTFTRTEMSNLFSLIPFVLIVCVYVLMSQR